MADDFQIAIDCQRPHELAGWWAETLGWRVEPQDENFIKEMIAKGYASEDDTMMHNGALVWTEGAAIRHPDDPDGTRPRVLFQLVPEPKTVKNRLHLDLRPDAPDREARIAELTARGATVLHTGAQGPHTWVTMADPEGNEFCVT
jgi:glyoxalase superfamily protein